jgi:hypothetical protein
MDFLVLCRNGGQLNLNAIYEEIYVLSEKTILNGSQSHDWNYVTGSEF